jgi:hypothetical protein
MVADGTTPPAIAGTIEMTLPDVTGAVSPPMYRISSSFR